jgi:hypothetical protein
MIKQLLVFGDSNSYGSETVADNDHSNVRSPDLAYGKYVQQLLNISEYANMAKPGSSNSIIVESVLSYLPYIKSKSETLILIGWSESNRITLNIKSHGYNITESMIKMFILYNRFKTVQHSSERHLIAAGDIGRLAPLVEEPFMLDFIKGLMLYYFSSDSLAITDISMRLCVDSLLSTGGYKFLAFPTLGDPNHPCIQTYMNLFSPYSMFGLDFLRQYSKYGVSATGGHLKTEAHKKVADALVEEIKKRNIL